MNDFEKRSLQEFKDMHDRIKNLVFHNHLDDGYGDIMMIILNKAIIELETRNDY